MELKRSKVRQKDEEGHKKRKCIKVKKNNNKKGAKEKGEEGE